MKVFMVYLNPHGDGFELIGIYTSSERAKEAAAQNERANRWTRPQSGAWEPIIDEVELEGALNAQVENPIS
jgi:hypothetical protein